MVKPTRLTGQRFATAGHLRAAGESPYHLVNCDLSGADLRVFDLSHSIFDACNFTGASLLHCHHSEFHSCDLRRAKLTGADFRWVKATNCRVDNADLVGIQTTLDCNFWSGLTSELAQDAYLLLYWLGPTSPLTRDLAEKHIPDRVKVFLQQTFNRDISSRGNI